MLQPTPELLTRLSEPWIAAYSAGKDSTTMIAYIECLRRSGWIDVASPLAVQSDTGVEDQSLMAVSRRFRKVLGKSGWVFKMVRPKISERLYTQILGRGLPPIHPGIRNFRWCSRSTKKDPMGRFRRKFGNLLTLTGLRWGESDQRDAKLVKAGCQAGGECGVPDPDNRTYSPIINWSTCMVIDWLNGIVDRETHDLMADVFEVTRELAAVYGFRTGQPTFSEWGEAEVQASRFGCRGCPAIGAEAEAPRSVVNRNGKDSPLNEIYAVWHEAREPHSRIKKYKFSRKQGKFVWMLGCLRMDARKRLFDRIMDIQVRAGVRLVTPAEEKFIRQCWERKVYPRGYSEADESTEMPDVPMPLFEGEANASEIMPWQSHLPSQSANADE